MDALVQLEITVLEAQLFIDLFFFRIQVKQFVIS